jgi:arginase
VGILSHITSKTIICLDGDRPIHLTYDIDAIDPHVCPSTGTKVRGGLSYREARHICEAVSETGRLVGMDIVEVNPCNY